MYFKYQIQIYKNENSFQQHKCNKNIASAHLHCQRDWKNSPLPILDIIHETEKFATIIYFDITEYVYLFLFLSFYSISYSLVLFVTMTKVKAMLNW